MWAQVLTWVVLAFIVIGALAPDADEEVATTEPTATTVDESPAATEAPAPTDPPATAPPPTEPPAPQWVEVATLSGTSEKQGDTFVLEGGKARLRYEFDAGDFGIFTAYIVDEGDSLDESGGFPEVTCSESCSDETLLRK